MVDKAVRLNSEHQLQLPSPASVGLTKQRIQTVDLSATDICTVYDEEKVYEEPRDHEYAYQRDNEIVAQELPSSLNGVLESRIRLPYHPKLFTTGSAPLFDVFASLPRLPS
ncbi:hypothetical protein H257_16178 [Aphanomyces astaci]|uniref:Uncharacterized protein n=1 Tax=Aphanomyces astaci TaxID=112090 RepID=W4FLZ7_APHAT|nr:hypothetical protein H257_16178 [Aphanomyces astaci]ETV67713.1 hypothetical protein H257_16178 [Aphanomyces astaci]|eukprot:XP_009842834.1 hypothetical protein H257_16178 [Aphanomyces astaci]